MLGGIAGLFTKLQTEPFSPNPSVLTKPRFVKLDRVVFKHGDADRPWAPGKIHELDARAPDGRRVPYMVKADPPLSDLHAILQDKNSLLTSECCFGQREGALLFTICCLPPTLAREPKRFGVGDRVACAVEDESGSFTVGRLCSQELKLVNI